MAGPSAPDRVVRICEARLDDRTLRARLLEEIGRVVGFDAYAWVLTDPVTSVGASPLAEVPSLSELPRLIRLKYLTEVNRWTTLMTPVATLAEATSGDPSRSLLWRELLAHHDVDDVLSCVFVDAYGCWAFLDLWRVGGRFTTTEVGFLTQVVAPITTALRRAQADTFANLGERRARGPVVLLLSPDLRVLAQTPETQQYLQELLPPGGDRSPVPASAYNVAAQLLSAESGVDANPAKTRVHLDGGLWLTLRAARIGADGPRTDREIAVTIEECPPAERTDVFARAHALSARESELLGHLVAGRDTRELARLMFLSEHTVQDHLKSIFAKTSAHGRRTLVSRALGT